MKPDLDTVRKKIGKIFPHRDVQEILALLEDYGKESHETGKVRVYLAILKLCDEENLPDPAHYVQLAKQDFRDVLAWAEYPHQMKFEPTKEPAKKAALKQLDEEQYRAWLTKE